MGWLSFLPGAGRRRSPFNNVGPEGLTCGQVTPHLFVGGELGPRDCCALVQEGISVIVNLQQEQQDIFTSRERGILEGYLWLPASDGLAPTLQQLSIGVDFIRASVAAGQSVLVHCKAGQGRAPLLCACCLITEGATPLDAIAQVRRARPQTMLTPDQSRRLREFAAMWGAAMDAGEIPGTSANGAPASSGDKTVAMPERTVSRSAV